MRLMTWHALSISPYHTDCASSTYSKASGGTVSANTWKHVAVTVDTGATSNQVKIYLDGVDQTETSTSPSSGVTIGNGGASTALQFGAPGGSCTNACMNYAGYLDEMRIWSAALSSATINTWMGWVGRCRLT